MVKLFGIIGALFGAMSVAMGAFGAHALRSRVLSGQLEERALEVWQTAASYQMYHALALLALCAVGVRAAGQGDVALSVKVSGIAFIVGVTLFSGSLYAMTLTGVRALGAITPIGGVALIVGWIALCVTVASGR